MQTNIVISDRFLEQYQPILKTILDCGYQNKLPQHHLTRIKKINARTYSLSNWGQAVAGTLSPALFWKVLRKSTASRHFISSN
jgi:hypothetical protein